MYIPFISDLLIRIFELVINIAGTDPDVLKVFESLIEFFSK